ncbi:hypothetical protein MG293_005968 [Ovis ammon polii]|uniref:Uncharacterized protein n=1 Tax=Ovis ammon polii TaxID=230172 RepID=A0AAD4UFS5_OVIAM|nr:hypothetical protein MG293_005968 [Ovis ammon polii]
MERLFGLQRAGLVALSYGCSIAVSIGNIGTISERGHCWMPMKTGFFIKSSEIKPSIIVLDFYPLVKGIQNPKFGLQFSGAYSILSPQRTVMIQTPTSSMDLFENAQNKFCLCPKEMFIVKPKTFRTSPVKKFRMISGSATPSSPPDSSRESCKEAKAGAE